MKNKQTTIYFVVALILLAGVLFWFLIKTKSDYREPINVSAKEDRVKEMPIGTHKNPNQKVIQKEGMLENKISTPLDEVTIAGKQYAIRFEKDDLSEETKRIIVDDLNLNMAHIKSFSFEYVGEDEKVGGIPIAYIIDNVKPKRWYPEQWRGSFGGAVKNGNVYALIIPNKLVVEYKKSIKLMNDHEVAFKKVGDFLSLLNSPDALDEIITDSQKAKELSLRLNTSKDYGLSKRFSEMKKIRLRDPSILDFKLYNIKGGEHLVFCTLQYYLKDNGSVFESEKGALLYVYADGNWKIYNPFYP